MRFRQFFMVNTW